MEDDAHLIDRNGKGVRAILVLGLPGSVRDPSPQESECRDEHGGDREQFAAHGYS